MSKPWEKPTPKSANKTKLTPASIAWARASAKKAGRRYPNLIDNMTATRRQLEAEQKQRGPGFLDRP
jgi:hypothetical protein